MLSTSRHLKAAKLSRIFRIIERPAVYRWPGFDEGVVCCAQLFPNIVSIWNRVLALSTLNFLFPNSLILCLNLLFLYIKKYLQQRGYIYFRHFWRHLIWQQQFSQEGSWQFLVLGACWLTIFTLMSIGFKLFLGVTIFIKIWHKTLCFLICLVWFWCFWINIVNESVMQRDVRIGWWWGED